MAVSPKLEWYSACSTQKVYLQFMSTASKKCTLFLLHMTFLFCNIIQMQIRGLHLGCNNNIAIHVSMFLDRTASVTVR